MRTFKFHHVDSFTNTLFGGNPTVAVLNADSLSEVEMKKIAREMNLSETSFMLSSDKANFKLKFFTPAGNEMKFCGHATLGALCTIAREGLFGCTKPLNTLSIETNAGLLNAEVDLSDRKAPKYIFDSPQIILEPAAYSIDDVIQGLGISNGLIDESKPVMLEKNNQYLYLAAKNLDSLGKIKLDLQKATEFTNQHQIIVICILTNETFTPENHLHARGFAPLVGLPEDPFTGSMQGGLAAYAMDQQLLQPNEKWIGVEQGHFMGRPGFVKLRIEDLSPLKIRLYSEAVPVFSSEFILP